MLAERISLPTVSNSGFFTLDYDYDRHSFFAYRRETRYIWIISLEILKMSKIPDFIQSGNCGKLTSAI